MLAVRVELIRKRWLLRDLSVKCPEGIYQVSYFGWGIGYETILVNGVEVARRTGPWSMSASFEFLLGNRAAAVTVFVPWWKNLFIVPWPSYFQFALEGRTLYEEGFPPARRPRTIVMACRRCRYDIRASVLAGQNACPECGAAIGPLLRGNGQQMI